ncbi:RIP metalloprotease RseP [Parasporobacterium paucivorans]|uniref:Zinc metalloprotease n=1 Tax=Parasporobacterium paucivorans DSM 15970 TaxID=1122934 RepID=A0A1M6AGF5_9FIRM|nr:RIP metalloprotease RseP [Parasporobacterium paucivorans]SHI35398.1 regulator of sigma E protease [Parasporobacterium paucivorans DSM 15970]
MKIIIALIVFSILIIIHELGHFLLAKKNDILVVEFSLGMGPRLFSFTKGETKYSLKLLPFGGSCAMLGEDEDLESERSFNKKSVWARISVIVAGPVFNFLLAFVLALIVIGLVGYDPSRVTAVDPEAPVYETGIREGDTITSFNDRSVHFGREIFLEEYINPASDKSIDITYERNGKESTASFLPKAVSKYAVGIRYYSTDAPAQISEVVEGGAMKEAGVNTGDIITSVNGTVIENGIQLGEYLQGLDMGAGEALAITLERNGKSFQVSVIPEMSTYYELGFAYNLMREKTSPWGVMKYSFFELTYQIETVFRSLVLMVSGHVSADDISGPVGIVGIIGDTYSESLQYGALMTIMSMANLTIMLSTNLGVINLIPFPALDGGRLFFLVLEGIRRKPIPKEKEGLVHFIGMILLMALMVFIIFNDLKKL